MKLPPLSTQDIIEQNLGDEILLFNLKTNKALSLNKTAATVYKYCDGQTTLEKVCRDEGLTKEIVYLSLKELEKENLVELAKDLLADLKNISRREVVRKVGTAGIFALPVLAVIVAPTSA